MEKTCLKILTKQIKYKKNLVLLGFWMGEEVFFSAEETEVYSGGSNYYFDDDYYNKMCTVEVVRVVIYC